MDDLDTLLERAIQLATGAHRGQRDKVGAPYILHPLRMMLRVRTPEERIVAVLHDVVEDTPWTIDALRREGFPESILQAVDCLTKRKREPYEQSIKRAKPNPIARVVKLADLEDNSDLRRLRSITAKDRKRLEKYKRAIRILQASR